MEIIIALVIGVAVIGWFIWNESKDKKNTKASASEMSVAPILTETVATPTADISADRVVETETVAAPKKTKKPVKKPVAKIAAPKAPKKATKPKTKSTKTK